MEPLKANLTDSVRKLESEIIELKLALKSLRSNGANQRRQTQAIQNYNSGPSTAAGTQAKFINASGDKPLSTTRFRNYNDITGNIRPYSFLTFLVDNFGPADDTGVGIANIIPPHHDMELFTLATPSVSGQNTSSSSKNIAIGRVGQQTRLGNLSQNTFPSTQLTSQGPGLYLCRAEIDLTLTRTIDSGNNHRAGSVRLIPAGTALILQGSGWRRWGRQVTWGSGDNHFSEVPGLWFLWRPNPGSNLSFSVSFTNCIEATGTNGVGTLLMIEIGKARELSDVSFNGTQAQSFSPSNSFFIGQSATSTTASTTWTLGPVAPPPS